MLVPALDYHLQGRSLATAAIVFSVSRGHEGCCLVVKTSCADTRFVFKKEMYRIQMLTLPADQNRAPGGSSAGILSSKSALLTFAWRHDKEGNCQAPSEK